MVERGALEARGVRLPWGVRTYVMGIVNVTPDSFSGDGTAQTDRARDRALRHLADGADLIDLGGESTRPGHIPVDEATELARVLPVVRILREGMPRALLSIDTTKPAVARAAADAGADVLNCVQRAPEELLEIAAERGMAFVAMHNQSGTQYDGDVVDAVLRVLEDCAQAALRRGIARERIVLDPGIGFGKTAEQNLQVLRRLDRVVALGFPTLLGASRKSTLGKLTGREPGERAIATAATSVLAAAAGIDIVRVHDVAATCDALRIADATVREWRPAGWTG
ncbi:MAG TPA: dihydropteroate synthase [Candidatus Tyrphobacter sp.]